MAEYEPIVNQWYRQLDKGFQFQVVAVDEEENTVEIQHFDGDLEEFDFDTWEEMELELIEPPEDWTGGMDDIERDDLGYSETEMREGDWSAPSRERAGATEAGWSEESDEEGEEEEEGNEGDEGKDERS